MVDIPKALRQSVIERAKSKCEYCLIHQDCSIYTHEIDHIIPVKHGGKNDPDNLALSCLSCNRYKGSDFATIDVDTGDIIPLFNPRRQQWQEHFSYSNGRIEGITIVGQVTARLLKFNTPIRIVERQILSQQNRYSAI